MYLFILIRIYLTDYKDKSEKKKFFNLVKNDRNRNYLIRSDFLPFMRAFLDYHPGLEFLKTHEEFQVRYGNLFLILS